MILSAISGIVQFPLQQPVAIFLVVLVIILLTPLVFNRLKIPHLVGMILAGVLVGPHGFDVLADDASFEIFGQVGILYLMFLAGVEIDMVHLRRNLRAGLIFGIITFLIPLAVGLVASRLAFSMTWSAAAIVATMYASHTLISYPVVNRFGLSNARPVVVAVCGTIVAVFLALLTLGAAVGVSVQGSFGFGSLVKLLLSTAAYVGAMAYIYPKLARLFFRNFNESVTQFIFVLALVFLASLIAQLIGLEAILGAFLSGLVLNRFVPGRSALMRHIGFVGNAIFIPYFLIGVGMLLNVRSIFDGWGVAIAAGVMIVVALSTKWVSALIGQKILGMPALDRRIMFGLTSGKAAATLAVIMIGYQYNLLPADVMNGAVVMILVCCIVASVATERAVMRLRMDLTAEELKQEHGPQRRNARQLVAVANPITAESLMRLTVLMRHPRNDLPITALFVRNSDDPTVTAMGRNALQTAVQAAVTADVPVHELERYDVNIGAGLINAMKERDCTDLIIGLHRKSNIVDTFYGSLTEQLLRSSNRMITLSRCFIPVNTVRRLVIVAPRKAEYETGFRMWVERMGNLTVQLGCRAIFIAHPDTIPYIQGVLTTEGYEIRQEYRPMSDWDDFILHAGTVEDDDLLVIIGARRTSISFSTDMENIPNFLSRYFSRHNVLVVYPEQFGQGSELPTPIDPLSQSISTAPSPAWSLFRKIFGSARGGH